MSTFFGKYKESELRSAMTQAVAEAAVHGRAGLRRKYGLGPATKLVAIAAGHHLDGNALVAAAAAHLDPPMVLTSSDFSGGVATTGILDACDIPWADADDLLNVPGLHISANPPLSDPGRPKYWWVNQNENYTTTSSHRDHYGLRMFALTGTLDTPTGRHCTTWSPETLCSITPRRSSKL
ncbi:hypothetical protein [Sinomonas sp. P10A9]|uniref:ScoMcrA-like N-terminal head domain-containing protein n=1 Tax=Sinomonas puerhi TaxID=3238584 RepID=A0AB39L7U6_9MICC